MLAQPPTETSWARLEFGQFGQGGQVIGVSGYCSTAPPVQGVGAGVQPSVADPGPYHGQYRGGGGFCSSRRLPDRDDIGGEVAHLVRFPSAALAVEPVGEVRKTFNGPAPPDEVQK